MPSIPWPAGAWRNSRTARLLAIAALGLLLNIPMAMIEELVFERQARSASAREEMTTRWGGRQVITGPALLVPISRLGASLLEDGRGRNAPRHAVFLPRTLNISAELRTDVRRRGIFSVPVYTVVLNIDAEFTAPDLEKLGLRAADADWEQATLALGISDVHALPDQPVLDRNGHAIPFQPGVAQPGTFGDGIHVPLELDGDFRGERMSVALTMNGSGGIMFTPFAEKTRVEMRSNYPHPGFQGKWLPVAREIGSDGFAAQWAISWLGRGYAQSWIADGNAVAAVDASRFGVELAEPVDHYRMTERSVKYAILFVLLTFLLLWLIEVLSGIRVHPVQFLLVGTALCLFYLLELSLAEHIGFAAAYALAGTLIVVLIGAYSVAALQSRSRAAAVAAACSGLYGYLYFLLANEDYSLLIGSLVLFAILAAVMYVTRRKDWYATD